MGIHDSIFPDAVWNSVDGTMKSSSANCSYSAENEVVPQEQPLANVSSGQEDVTVSTSMNDGRFVDYMISTMRFITNELNIENQTYMDYWPEYCVNVIMDVGLIFHFP